MADDIRDLMQQVESLRERGELLGEIEGQIEKRITAALAEIDSGESVAENTWAEWVAYAEAITQILAERLAAETIHVGLVSRSLKEVPHLRQVDRMTTIEVAIEVLDRHVAALECLASMARFGAAVSARTNVKDRDREHGRAAARSDSAYGEVRSQALRSHQRANA